MQRPLARPCYRDPYTGTDDVNRLNLFTVGVGMALLSVVACRTAALVEPTEPPSTRQPPEPPPPPYETVGEMKDALGPFWTGLVEDLLPEERKGPQLVQPGIELVPTDARTLSRFGGQPDLPDGQPWPTCAEGPLAFLLQVDLEELPSAPPASFHELGITADLPAAGLLLVFYDHRGWGERPDAVRVLHVEHADLPAAPRAFPGELDDEGRFPRVGMTLAPLDTLLEPDQLTWQDPFERHVSAAESDAHFDAWFDELQGTRSQLLGEPLTIQNPMRGDCVRAAERHWDDLGDRKRTAADRFWWGADKPEDIPNRRKRWRLLLQVDSHPETGMMWGDAGRVYLWIHDEDLAEGRFDRVWPILQCY